MKRETITGVKGVIFDLDGTLFDSVDLWHHIDDVFLSKRGFVADDEYRHGIAALGFKQTAFYTIDYFGLDDTPEQLMAEWSEMAREAYANDIVLFDGVKEYLQEVSSTGLKIAAVTSLCPEFALSCLKHNGIFEFFDEIITSDDTGLSKTSPDIFLRAAEKLGVECGACVAFDDVTAAVIAAKQAGMITVAVGGKMFNESKADGAADHVVEDWHFAPTLKMAK